MQGYASFALCYMEDHTWIMGPVFRLATRYGQLTLKRIQNGMQ